MQNSLKIQSRSRQASIPFISRILNPLLWIVFFMSLIGMVVYLSQDEVWHLGTYIRLNGLSFVMISTVTFFGALISHFSNNYLRGFKYQHLFSYYSLGFICAVILFVISNHALLIIFSWYFMGVFMAKLIGVNSDWGEARASARVAMLYFLGSTLALILSLGILIYYTDSFFLEEIFLGLESVPYALLLISALFLIVAGLIQSALFPFHKWLLSAMTSPTPASALMHAGFINGAGVLFTIFAAVLVASDTLALLFVLGGFTAIFAQFVKLLQVNVKHKLACSTIAQMGFMVMQCGLGFFNAAIAHLILHGFYKAYLFLSSGEQIEMRSPQVPDRIRIQIIQGIIIVLFGLVGGGLFMWMTSKTSLTSTSIFLTIVVAITVGQTSLNIIKEPSLNYAKRIGLSLALFIAGIAMYALVYNGISFILQDVSYSLFPHKLTYAEIIFGILFLVGFLLMRIGIYRKTPWLYVKLLNITQPHQTTVLKFKK